LISACLAGDFRALGVGALGVGTKTAANGIA